jgi:hypothetical protein
MKLSAGILLVTLWAGTSLAQIPNVIQHVQDKMNGVQQQKKAASDEALQDNNSAKAPAGKPSAASAQKAAPAQPAAASAPKAAAAVATKPVSTPVAKATAPAPAAKAQATPVAKAAPSSAAITKTPVAAKAPVKQDPFAKSTAPKTVAKSVPVPVAVPVKAEAKKPEPKKAEKADAKKPESPDAAKKAADTTASAAKPAESGEEAADQKKESGYITAGNRRDPFVSPIVQHLTGAGCSTGKRCLAIDQIALRGIVKSDGGMIAVVVNSLDKAYFLRENDPVFNGYVLKISGDSVVFKETVQDKLGHLSTREVVKKITTPAV